MESIFNVPAHLNNFRAYVNSFDNWEASTGETLSVQEVIVTKNTFPSSFGILVHPISELEKYRDLSRARWNISTSKIKDASATIDAYGVGKNETKVKFIDGHISYLPPHERKNIGPAFNEFIKMLINGIPETSKENKELEQKFKILLSPSQEQKDFNLLKTDAEKFNYHIGILFLDIDNFKTLNSKYTEAIIDKTLLVEAQLFLRQLTHQRGKAYRHGGEEFVVILPNYDLNETIKFAEKLRIAFEDKNFIVDNNEQKITVSIGVALWPQHGNNFSEVLAAANKAENQAKKSGGNKVIGAE
jgi:diguanylate cyclase (GGDEF)-like protein